MTWALILFAALIFTALIVIWFCVFFDQAVLTRSGTIYRVRTSQKRVALTFDDGPSPIWTPKILDELKKTDVKATFFMIGHHVKVYPEVARRVVAEGHEIGNHGYAHTVILYYTPAEIEEEIKYTEYVIKDITGYTTKYFRPPKAWMPQAIKEKIKAMGYEAILWSLNSKDWVSFNHKLMVRYLVRHVKSGDIILFHDSGDVFKAEGGDRLQTVLTIEPLVRELRTKGFEFVTIKELLDDREIS